MSNSYVISPIGLNTAYTESLTSYITRISEAHSINVGTLLKSELTTILNKHYFTNSTVSGGNSFLDYAHALNGTQKNAFDFIQAMSILTCREDILFTTMISWKNVIPVRGLLKESQSWCTICFEEWKSADKPIYIPLIWSLKVVSTCLIHDASLVMKCSKCQCEEPFLHRKGCNGCCPNCSSWLGASICNVNILSEEEKRWQSWVNHNIGRLISITPTLNSFPLRNGIIDKMNQLINLSNYSITKFSKVTGIPKTTISDWANGKKYTTHWFDREILI